MYIYVCVYTVYLYVYIRGETMTECDVNGQSATYQLGNQWYRLPARSNVRHTVDGAVEIVSRMSEIKKISKVSIELAITSILSILTVYAKKFCSLIFFIRTYYRIT